MTTKVSKTPKKYPPERAYTPPNLVAIILFYALTIFTITQSIYPLGGALFFVLAPLTLFTSYHSGLTLAKINYKLLKKKKIWLVCSQMLMTQIIVVALCSIIIFAESNFTSIQIDVFGRITDYYFEGGLFHFVLFSLICFAPMLYAIWLYYGWVIARHIPKPKTIQSKAQSMKKVY